MEKAIKLSAEVANALKAGKPVVALESTIISHGLPRPSNLEVALECERIVRDAAQFLQPSHCLMERFWSD